MEPSVEGFISCSTGGFIYNCSTLTATPAVGQESFLFSLFIFATQLAVFLFMGALIWTVRFGELWSKYSPYVAAAFDDFAHARVSFRFIYNKSQMVEFCSNKANYQNKDRHVFMFAIVPSQNWLQRFEEDPNVLSESPVPSSPLAEENDLPITPPKTPPPPLLLETDLKTNKTTESNESEKDVVVEKKQEDPVVEAVHELLKTPRKPLPPSAGKATGKIRVSPSVASAAEAISAVLAEKFGQAAPKPELPKPSPPRRRESVSKAMSQPPSPIAQHRPCISMSTSVMTASEHSAIPLPQLPDAPVVLPGGVPPPPPPLPTTLEVKTIRFPKPSRPVKCFNWVPLPDFKIRGTIWENVRPYWPCTLQRLDLVELEEIFCQKAPGRRSSTPRPSDDRSGGHSSAAAQQCQIFSVIDSRRAHNLNILLSSAIRLPIEELVKLISTMDVNNALSADVCSNLIRNFPTEDEVRLLQRFRDNLNNFASADRFLYELSTIPRCQQKLSALVYRKNFNENVEQIRPKLEAVINCSRQLRESKAFARTLEITLAIGNYLNSFSRPKQVNGFKLTSLLRLGDTKSSRRATFSLVDYVRKALAHPPVCLHCSEKQQLMTNTEMSEQCSAAAHLEQPIKISAEVTELKSASVVGELGGLNQEIASLRAGMAKLEQESQMNVPLSSIVPPGCANDQLEKIVLSEKAFKDAMAAFCHNDGGKLVELEKLYEVAVDEYRRTLVYFGEVDSTLDSNGLKRSIESAQEKPENEKEPSIFMIVEQFVAKVEASPAILPPSFYSRRSK